MSKKAEIALEEWKINNTSVSLNRWPVTILVAILFSSTLALFGPAQLFFTNSLEFGFRFSQILPYLGVVAFCVFLLTALIVMLLPDRFRLHERGVALVFVLGFLLWFQGNFLVWRYGFLNGQEIDWGSKILYGLLDTPIWIAGLFLAAWRPEFLYRRAKMFSLLLIAVQLLASVFLAMNQPELPAFKKFQIESRNEFNFSKRKNIIILVLDTFQSDVFQEIIDQDPAYKDDFKDFTYFRNTLGGFPTTYAAVPFILTAQYYTNSQPIQSFIAAAYSSPSSIPRALLKRGWEVDLFPVTKKTVFMDPTIFSNIRISRFTFSKAKLAYLFDLTLFRYLPHFLKRGIYKDGKWFLTRWGRKADVEDILDEDEPNAGVQRTSPKGRKARRSPQSIRRLARLWKPVLQKSVQVQRDVQFMSHYLKNAVALDEKNVFKFYRLRGIHEPILLNADLEPVKRPMNRQNVVDLARAELKLTHLFLEGLRALGVYDDALIFVLGDHGHPYGKHGLRLPQDMTDNQSGSAIPKGVLESGIPLLLVKRPGDRGVLRINDAPASLADVSATVFDDLGIRQAGTGEPLFRIPVDRPRERRFLYYYWEHLDFLELYLPKLFEYRVMGNCWLRSSWHATGAVFEPGR